MTITFFKRVGVVITATMFAIMPALNVGATAGKQVEADQTLDEAGQARVEGSAETALWGGNTVNGDTYCEPEVAAIFTAKCSPAEPSLSGAPAERYITITMHVGEDEGYFETEEGNVQSISEEFFYNDAFNNYSKPVSKRNGYAFVGWTTTEGSDEVDVEVGVTRAVAIGTDLYPVWSQESYVIYRINGGVWDAPDGNEYGEVMMRYDTGTKFIPLDPEPRRIEPYYDFVGWTSEPFGNGERYTADTDINKYLTEVYTEWKYNPNKIDDEMVVNEIYNVTAGVSVPLYKFTPTESGWYEVFTDGLKEDGTDRQAMIRLQDEGDHTLKMEQLIDPWVTDGEIDMHLYYEMEAGQTYYIRLGEMSGMYLNFNAGVRKAETTTVTFDGNRGSNAWFDGDHSKTTKDMTLPIGDNIAYYLFDQGVFEYDSEDIVFTGWADEADPAETHSALLITGPMTVYAQYREMVVISLDYNGGYNPFKIEETAANVKFNPFDFFETPIDPKIDNPRLKFSGWSTDPNATDPDPKVVEGKDSSATLAEYLNGRTLYAVYKEPVSVTFNTIGGAWMMDDPDVTTYESSLGRGHIFYGMAVMHYHPLVEHAGWRDQNGVFIAATSGIWSSYTIEEDTVFTSVLEFKLMADGNGGVFPKGGVGGFRIRAFRAPYDGWQKRFSYDEVLEILGEPIPDDETKEFLGFGTNPDLEEPDIIDGVTYLEDLDYIYAIWGDKSEEEPDEDDTTPDEDEEVVVPDTADTGAKPGAEGADASVSSYAGLATVLIMLVLFEVAIIRQQER